MFHTLAISCSKNYGSGSSKIWHIYFDCNSCTVERN